MSLTEKQKNYRKLDHELNNLLLERQIELDLDNTAIINILANIIASWTKIRQE